ncbi:hypothetical protein ACFFJT_07035 [Dyella flava]|uniref:Membrane domain of glycerophosphoryl diester phosphodiesterase n=1 Tax=Dyella flava TaxID=1920170 RepID=A0ABS2KAI5_9GAMM|nr:hypothetical protein [Dyella flava]MBM7127343.1 hypothetical protein [Dyella flava]
MLNQHGAGAPLIGGIDTMATRSRGPSAGFDWLNRGISAGIRHPKPLFGAAGLLMLAVLIPALISTTMQFQALHSGMPMQPTFFGWMAALSMLISLLVFPLYAGYLLVIDAAERGLPARAVDIFRPYREGNALRVIGFGVVMLLIYAAMLVAVFTLTGGGVAHWYMQVLTARANHQLPPTTLPDGFGITFLLIMLVAIFMVGFHSIGLGQVALGNRGVFGAIGDGMIGAVKNLLPLLMLALGLILVWIAAALCIGIAAFLLALIGKLVGALVLVLIIPLYIALLLLVITAMYGVAYHLWRDVCGDDVEPGFAEPLVA